MCNACASRKKLLKASRGLQKNSRIENFSHPLPPVISNDPSLTLGDTKHFLKNAYYLHLFVLHWCVTFRLQVPCMLAAQILKPHGILYVWLLSHSSVVVLLISNIQYKKFKLITTLPQIDFEIPQAEAVRFYCCVDTRIRLFLNYFNCVFRGIEIYQ